MKRDYIKAVMRISMGTAIAGGIGVLFSKKSKEQGKKMEQYYHILIRWLKLHQEDKTLCTYFQRMGYHKIGIYGMKELGQRLFCELKGSDIEMILIDKAADHLWFEDDIISPVDAIPEVDVIVVTAAYYFDSIRKELEQKVKCPIISISDVVNKV